MEGNEGAIQVEPARRLDRQEGYESTEGISVTEPYKEEARVVGWRSE